MYPHCCLLFYMSVELVQNPQMPFKNVPKSTNLILYFVLAIRERTKIGKLVQNLKMP